jgi:hypothetical protein
MANLTGIKPTLAHLRQHRPERTSRRLLHQRTRNTNLI